MEKIEPITAARLSPKCVELRVTPRGPDWSLPILLASDQHFDSPDCDRALLKKHLDEVKAAGGAAFFLGDWWDAMQGRRDNRAMKSSVLPQYARSDYLNALVEDTVEFLTPYAHLIAGWARGNHETSITKHTEFDLLSACITELNLRTGSQIMPMGYTGWIFLRFHNYRNQAAETKKIWYTHGSGGGGAVSKGVLQTARRAVYLPDAQFVLSGHIHEQWQMILSRERINKSGVPYLDEQIHLQLPTYKDEFSGDGDGWWHETGKAPRPLGAWILDLSRSKIDQSWVFHAVPRRAQ